MDNQNLRHGTRGGFPALALITVASLWSHEAGAVAGYGIAQDSGILPPISVVGNGTEYTGIAPTLGGAWLAEFWINATSGNIKNWKVYPYKPKALGNSPGYDLSLYAESKSYPVGQRPQSVHEHAGQIFPVSLLVENAVARCNHHLSVLEGQGLTKQEIFAEDRSVFETFRFAIRAELTGAGGPVLNGIVERQHEVICLAHEGAGEPPGAAGVSALQAAIFQVTGASLQVLLDGHPIPTKAERDCPAELNFLGHIAVKGDAVPATVKYRFDFASGHKSPVYSKEVTHTDASAIVLHQVAIPLAGVATPGGAPGGGGGGGFAPQPQPAGPQLGAATLPANEHKDSVRLVVLTHGGATSGPAGYHIACKPSVTDGVAGPDGMAVPAKPPMPGRGDRGVSRGGDAGLRTPSEGRRSPRAGDDSRSGKDPARTDSDVQSGEGDFDFLTAPASRTPTEPPPRRSSGDGAEDAEAGTKR